ncbi:MAG: branched-chain amino acid ABC transporter permease [Nanoarchaeota archaeon]
MEYFFFLQFLLNGIIAGSLYALVAVGFSLVYTTCKFINFAHGASVILAAYLMHICIIRLHLRFVTAIIIVIVAVITGGWFYHSYIDSMKNRTTSNNLLIISITVLVLIENFLLLFFGTSVKSKFVAQANLRIASLALTAADLLSIVLMITIFLIIFLLMNKTTLGRKLKAVSDHELLSAVHGIDTRKMQKVAFLISSGVAALAGILMSMLYTIEPFMGTSLMLKGFAGSIIGGVTSVVGSMLGGLFIGILEHIGIVFLPSEYKDAITFFFLFVFLLFRKQGIMGGKI